jgi:hypothetical protein
VERGNGIPKEVEVDKRREVVFEERAMLRVSDMLDILRFLWSPYNKLHPENNKDFGVIHISS